MVNDHDEPADPRPIDALTDEEREQEIARLEEAARRHRAEAEELLRYKRERQARPFGPKSRSRL